MTIDDKSERLLHGVHPDLCSVVRRAREITEFRLTEGLRTLARQKQLKAQGKSRTLNSRHLTGHAVDVVDLKGSYAEADMRRIAEAMKQAAAELSVPITWGGDWSTFCDTPHFELEWHAYPAGTFKARAKAVIAGAAGTGGGVVAVPQAPKWIGDSVASVEANIALASRSMALVKGVMTFELASMIGLAGLILAAACLFLPTGGANASAGD